MAEFQVVRRIGETLSDIEGVASADAASKCLAMKSTNTRRFGERKGAGRPARTEGAGMLDTARSECGDCPGHSPFYVRCNTDSPAFAGNRRMSSNATAATTATHRKVS
mgnify:CR=1 FL=1